jgi:hypothetical protein
MRVIGTLPGTPPVQRAATIRAEQDAEIAKLTKALNEQMVHCNLATRDRDLAYAESRALREKVKAQAALLDRYAEWTQSECSSCDWNECQTKEGCTLQRIRQDHDQLAKS